MSSAWYVGLTLALLAGSTELAARVVERRELRDDECVDDDCCALDTGPEEVAVPAQRSSRAASEAQ